MRTIQAHPAWLTLLTRAGWQLDNPDQAITVNHFQLPIVGQEVQIHTHFLAATA